MREQTSTLNKGHIPSLDGYRAIAVIIVLLTHFDFIEFGWISVQMFLVLSGYLITNGLLILKSKDIDDGLRFKRFWWRRLLRVFPLYYFYLFVLVMFNALFADKNIYFARIDKFFPYLYTYTYNLTKFWGTWEFSPLANHIWTLCVEEQFYLLWPLLILFTPNKLIKQICIALLFLIPLFRYALGDYLMTGLTSDYQGLVADTVNWFTFSHFDAFALGAAINFIDFKKIGNNVWRNLLLFCLFFYFAVGYINSEVLFGRYDLRTIGYPLFTMAHAQHVWAYSIGNFLSFAIICYLISCNASKISNAVTKFFALKPFVFIGNLSYGMYVFHWLLLTVLETFFGLQRDIFGFLIWYVCLVGLASAIYYSFELRFLKMKDKV